MRFEGCPRRNTYWDKISIGGQLVGFIHWSIIKDNTRTIYDLVVHPDYRRRGYGRALIKSIGTPIFIRKRHPFYHAIGFRDGRLAKEPVVIPSGKPWILTYTGRVVNPLDLKSKDICIEDIAHQLACVNRFAGCTSTPISVAQHSVYVSRLVEERIGQPNGNNVWASNNKQIQRQGLLHDAAEAYLGDVTKWLKAEMPHYIAAENRALATILRKFNCNTELHEKVERADRVMVMYEAPRGFGQAWDGLHLVPKPGYEPITPEELDRIGKWAPWGWRKAEEAFMVRYRHCMAK